MKILNYVKTHKFGFLLALGFIIASIMFPHGGALLAIAPVVLADSANPSDNMNPIDASKNPSGRPADETLQADERGGKTQLQGKAATATDVRDAGLEAEDYDADVVNFRKFRFPIETYIANKCRPVKVSSYEHGHYRSAATNLEAVFSGSKVTIQKGQTELSLEKSDFDNPECMTEFSTVILSGVDGYSKDENGNEIMDGELVLFVQNHKDESDKIKFLILNPPCKDDSGTTVEIPTGTVFYVGATACSESQIRVASETYLPERALVYLQKKNMTCIITNEFEEQDKKTKMITKDVIANALYNYKRKCARSHWNGVQKRIDVKVKETGNREAVYTEKGILRQIPMLYTHDEVLSDDDMMAITSLQFTDNSMSDSATAFCGKRAMKRLMKLVNSAEKYKDIGKIEVNDYGIRVRRWEDNFGTIEFVYDPTLDDIGYEDFMVIVDLEHAVRYYKRNEQTITQDMTQSGEAREAKAYNKSTIDCVALKGYNAVLVCPSSVALRAQKLGGIEASFESVAELPTGGELNATAKTKRYYLTANDADAGFTKGSIVEWDAELDGWKEFEGLIRSH